jgi:hypothetical protein
MKPLPKQHRCTECDRAHFDPAGLKQLEEHHNRCAHCGDDIYYQYVLKNNVWEQTGLGYHAGVLHLPCVEKLIGRQLTLDDFRFDLGRGGNTLNDIIKWAASSLGAPKPLLQQALSK